MRNDRHDAIERLRSRYLHDYRRIYSKPARIAFFEDLRRSAETADAPAWARFAAAMSAWLRKESDTALRLAAEAIAIAPDFAYAWNGRGNVLQSLKRYVEAHADYRRAIALDPACAHPWINLGNLLRRLKRYDEALAAYTTAVSLGPGYVRPWINTGTLLLDMGRRAEALAAYARATEVDPEYSHPWNCKGNVLLLEGRWAEALQAYDRAIALEPDYPDPWEGRSGALEGLGCHAEALAARARADALRARAGVRTDLRAYYAARAPEYDRVYLKPERQADLRTLREWVPAQVTGLRTLEVACGTGFWTQHIAPVARQVLAVDIEPEPLRIARARVTDPNVGFVLGDAYRLPVRPRSREAAFAGFWYSHVPRPRSREFLAGLAGTLAPGGLVVLLDNLFVPGSNLPIVRTDPDGNTYQDRTLADGSAHRVLKNFPDEAELRAASGTVADGMTFTRFHYYWAFTFRVR